MRRLKQTIAMIAAPILAVALVPSTIAATTASWPDEEWVNGTVGTSSYRCDSNTTGYAGEAYGRFLGGELLGIDLDEVAELEPQQLAQNGAGVVTVSPTDATPYPATPPAVAYANPLDLTLLSGLAGINLSGLGLGLPVGSLGAVNQYARVSPAGTAAGAAGLINDTGGVLVTPSTPADQLPQPATVSLDEFLPALTSVADVELEVGAVSASSTLDYCAALRNQIWEGGTFDGSDREYGIAGLDLQFQSDLVGDLVSTVENQIPLLNAALGSLVGSNGGIAAAINGEVLGDLSLLAVQVTSSGTVTLTPVDLLGAVDELLTTPLDDGIVRIDLVTGEITVDLAELLSDGNPNGLNSMDPNSELVLDPVMIDLIVENVATLLDGWTTQITTTLTDAISAATLDVNLNLTVGTLPVVLPFPLPSVPSVPLVAVGVKLNAPLSALLSDTPVGFNVTLDAIGVGSLLQPILDALSGLTTGLVVPVVAAITDDVLSLVTGLGGLLDAITEPLVETVAGLLDALPQVLSLMVNVQPDQPEAPDDPDAQAAVPGSSAEYRVTALRIGLVPALGDAAVVRLATASAGPITAP